MRGTHPPPWKIWRTRTSGERIILGGDGCALCDVHPGSSQDADARLIAKAPELLTLAHDIWAILDDCSSAEDSDAATERDLEAFDAVVDRMQASRALLAEIEGKD